jgi:alpha-tubulin suppressor-like RCC1 family protein
MMKGRTMMNCTNGLSVSRWLLLGLAVGGCSTGPGAPVPRVEPARPAVQAAPKTAPPPLLSDAQTEPAGANCPKSGIAILKGPDTNGDGALDLTEVTTRQYVCNGFAGKGVVLATRSEPVGANCPTGGKAIASGSDDNGNGLLDTAEVKATDYVCHGRPGTNGRNGVSGRNSLAVTIPEPAGVNCAAGGSKIMSGLDVDGNGVLAPAEVQNTGFACNAPDGRAALVDQIPEPAGESCVVGGIRVVAGVDVDGNGALSESEWTRSTYVCNGQDGATGTTGKDGAAGADGLDGVIRVVEESPGEACLTGGVKVLSGLDANRSSVLDDAEISSTSYVCNGANGRDGIDGRNGHDGMPGLTALTNAIPEPPGKQCPYGGARIESGYDGSLDGVLDVIEVTSTSFVCSAANGGDGSAGANGTSGVSSLVSVSQEPAGLNCAAGGQRIDSGADSDGSGALDAREINATSYVCNGAAGTNGTNGTSGTNGVSTLVETSSEPAGESCAHGGVRITSGPDTDGSGSLSAGEIVKTAYVCSGGDGATGGDGASALVVMAKEPAGGSCTYGGTKITSGLDTNGTGALDDAEITSTTFVCNGGSGATGASGTNALAATSDEMPGDNCAYGGTKVETGLDTNGTGALESGEVTKTTYVCKGGAGTNGTNGASTIVTTNAEPPGASCAYGGTKITSWIDTVANGVLDAGETTKTSYVCNGAPGTTGTAGANTLVAQAAEPAGTNCAYGGTKISGGPDTNGSGVLDASEVTATSYVCATAAAVVRSVYAGVVHGCASMSDGAVRCWGANGSRQLGDGTTTNRTSAVTVAGLSGVVALGTGIGTHTCAVLRNGTLACWGNNSSGQLGTGDTATRTTPVVVPGISAAVTVTTGYGHTCTLLTDGTARCWGYNGNGQLGNGTITASQLSPVAVNLNSIVSLEAGDSHTCAVRADGALFCWGYNDYGQVGDGTAGGMRPTPTQVPLAGVSSVSPGGIHTCAVLFDRTARCWGDNLSGQLGDGTTVRRTSPVTVVGLSNVVTTSLGSQHTCATLTDGTGRCWGYNAYGQLGDGTTTDRGSPTPVAGLSGALAVHAQTQTTCARRIDGVVACWGRNNAGQLGDGSITNRLTPVSVNGLR